MPPPPSPSTNPPSLLRKSVEAQQSVQTEPRRSSPQVTPMGLMITLSLSIAVWTAAVMVT
jgi:hypothetical protein